MKIISDQLKVCHSISGLLPKAGQWNSSEAFLKVGSSSIRLLIKNLNIGCPLDKNPVILFSHIPLSRPDTASCGPLREQGTIRRGVGHGYQNTLGKESTTFLLEQLRPSVIFR